jgi:type IV pilus assembly protein PilV
MTTLSEQIVPSAQQRGMTLIEILVAIVVLSIGLLGLAGLQLKGIQVNQGSTYRSQAAVLVEDIADRMRADRTGTIAGNYAVAASVPTAATATSLLAINEWLARLSTLPGATANIAAPVPGATAGSWLIGITVNWIDTRAQGGTGVAAANAVPGVYTVTMEL